MATNEISVHFVSQAGASGTNLSTLKRRLVPVRDCRQLRKTDLKWNDALPEIDVNPETYEVRADGELMHSDPVEILPLAQRYFLF